VVEIGEGARTLPRDSDSNEQSAMGVNIELKTETAAHTLALLFYCRLSDRGAAAHPISGTNFVEGVANGLQLS